MNRYIDILLWKGSAREQSSHHQYIDVAWKISHVFYFLLLFHFAILAPFLLFPSGHCFSPLLHHGGELTGKILVHQQTCMDEDPMGRDQIKHQIGAKRYGNGC